MPERFSLPQLLGRKYPHPTTAAEALERLLAGNRNFVAGRRQHPHESQRRRAFIAEQGQHPFALVVACSDSREAPEVLFDCGLGDLFAVRTAGQVLGQTALASVEFGVLHLGLRLVVVLGHSQCGAIQAALQAGDVQDAPGHLPALLATLRPSVEAARAAGESDLAEGTLRRHVLATVQTIREAEVLRGVPDLLVVGGRYDLSSGAVELLT
ncbi:carbonic anhydrase [Deinococcus sp. VB343]|uniref:carbonic anhydrase n=1 Tax=Deinococcus sp. VB343 TaxID=3385567 RepID=UPI0039C96FD9